jgi:hypothetical protein
MVAALLYLQVCSLVNRLRSQARRLRQPKYLAGAVAGGLYFYFFFLRGFLGGRSRGAAAAMPPEWLEFAEVGGALLLAGLVFLAWFVPEKRASLEFSEAEMAFLFPAPVARRTLIHYRLWRTQLPLLIGAAVMMLLTSRMGARGQAWMHLLGWWFLLCTLELHRLGAAFARTRLADRGLRTGWRRVYVVLLTGLFGLIFYVWARQTWPALSTDDLSDSRAFFGYVGRVADSGPLYWLLLPLRWVVRPMLADSPGAFVWAAGPALGIAVALYAWVLRSQVSFEEASIERAAQRAKVVGAMRSGNWHLAGGTRKAADPFPLPAVGPRPVALIWKNLISMGSVFSVRLWFMVGVGLIAAAGVAKGFFPESTGLKVLGGLPLGLLPMLLLLGPQLLVMDLRQDLVMADLLKTYPVRSWQLVWGEMLAPALVLTGVEWLLIGLGVALFPATSSDPSLADFSRRLAIGVAVAVVAPGINLLSLAVHNATVLLFPAWARPMAGQTHGFEAMGRQILMMAGQVLTLAITLLPAAAIPVLFFWLGRTWMPWLVLLPGTALFALAVLLAEAHAAAHMLGDLFERMDISEESLA